MAEAAVTTKMWIDPSSRWKATGQLQSDGSLKNATVDDNNGITRERNHTFSSESDFISCVRRHTN
ncbi:hypothetical protein [Streptomyces sp. NPDC051000]|uniref:hypothetical protein n=1 Tax=Streptomyces sp. NPDC051000 TaxID=3155520 RepID=UPI0033EF6ED8